MNMMSNQFKRFVSDASISAVGDLECSGIFLTSDVARDGDVWDAAGVDYSKFMRAGGTVDFDHNSEFPVATCTSITKTPAGELRFTARFPKPGISAKADEVRGLVKDGVVNALSAYINPLAVEPLYNDRGQKVGVRVTKSDLLNFSFVTSPSDTNCVITARSAQNLRRVADMTAKTSDRTDRKRSAGEFTSLAENLVAIARYKRDGVSDSRLARAPAGAGEGDPSTGGFLVQTNFVSDLIGSLYDQAHIAPLCDRRQTASPLAEVKLPAIDETSRADGSRHGGATSYWLAEGAAVSPSFPRFRNIELSAKKLVAAAIVSSELMADAPMLESHLRSVFAAEFGFRLDAAILSGSGAGVPLGILNSPALITVASEGGQTPGTIVLANVSKMWSRLPAPCRRRAVWIVSEDTEAQLDTLTVSSGSANSHTYIPAGVYGNPTPLLKGRPVLVIEQAAQLGSVGDIVLADLSQYLLIDGGVTPQVSADVRFLNDEVVWRFALRVDGSPAWVSPITPYNGGATRSPFVTLG